MKLVLIEWLDAHAGRGWQTTENIEAAAAPLVCRSVGWLLKDTKECKLIVSHLGGEENAKYFMLGCGDLTIPTCAIVKMTVLRESR